MLKNILFVDICQLLIGKQLPIPMRKINTPFVIHVLKISILQLIN
jgi:hypothetical protein